ncbi:T-lymphocyte surface antigen Ly-9-like [Xyrauchen texanus]|uniref:T-lymphocyte surface antigen Ly-9-like n=1 Tax=Xyrauchen texanus TaxID=154827 RepID=UPI00224196AC|nr:T-lymphocyte surface antigen Ly-9-like [Xyrauchen texanus]
MGAGEEEMVSVMEGDSVTLHTNLTEVHMDHHIVWMFGPQEIRIADLKDHNSHIYGLYPGRLKLDNKTGSMTISDVSITDSGCFKVEIISGNRTTTKTYIVSVYRKIPPEKPGEKCVAQGHNDGDCGDRTSDLLINKSGRSHYIVLISVGLFMIAVLRLCCYQNFRQLLQKESDNKKLDTIICCTDYSSV